MGSEKPLILLTNDDGIDSPGIHAAAKGLTPLGELILVAPRDQSSATGRSHPLHSDGLIVKVPCCLGTMDLDAYAIGGTPAQCVARAITQILPRQPDLVVSGINYGENFGTGITVSGTVGAALEAASFGIPTLAVSLQLLNIEDFDKFNPEVNFEVAAFFTHKFAAFVLEKRLSAPVDVLKIEIPANATRSTAWRMTRLARHNYYEPLPDQQIGWDTPNKLSYRINIRPDHIPADSDIHTVLIDQMVAVTPLTIDLTAPVDLAEYEKEYRNNGLGK
jgi:5'-nucleotidase